MNIVIDVTNGLPIYRQIANQISYMVASGILLPDEELPAIRTLAAQLRVTPNTIVKAYDELQSRGVISKRRGAGCFVNQSESKLANTEKRRILEQRIDALLSEAHQLNYSKQELLTLIEQRQTLLQGNNKDKQNKGEE